MSKIEIRQVEGEKIFTEICIDGHKIDGVRGYELKQREVETLNYQNIARAKAIEQENKKRLLKLNPKLNDRSGIYFLLREDEKPCNSSCRYSNTCIHSASKTEE